MLIVSLVIAQQSPRGGRQQSPAPASAGEQARPAAEAPKPLVEEKPVVTRHELRTGARTPNDTASAGMMPIKSQQGEIEANLFYVAYTLDGATDSSKRPLMIAFNGGPGAASVWLHMGCIGPKRVKMGDDGSMPAAPYQLVDNDQTWLDQADLVFVDPVGTGYSRAARPDLQRRFNGFEGDVQSVGEFVRLYLTRNERWASPLFLVGGNYRAPPPAAPTHP